MQEFPTDNRVFMFEKLSKALEILVAGPGDVRNRVFLSAKFLLQVTPQAVPESVREDIIWIRGMLKRKGDLITTFMGTRNVTASKIAGRVFDAYLAMHEEVQLAVNARCSVTRETEVPFSTISPDIGQ